MGGPESLGYQVEQRYEAHDALGNVLQWKTQTGTVELDVEDGGYTYDQRNRITSWTREGATESFDYDELGNMIANRSSTPNQVFGHATMPYAITSGPAGGVSYDHDPSGNVIRAGSKHYTYDSAERLTCIAATSGGACTVEIFYDAGGHRIREVVSGQTRRFFGDDLVRSTNPQAQITNRIEIFAFGERVGYADYDGGTTAARAPRGFEVPAWLVAAPPLAVLAGLLGLGLRGGLRVGVVRRPGYAALSGVLIAGLVVPHHARGGGGGGWDTVYRWVLSDRLGSGLVVLDEDGQAVRHVRFSPFGSVDAESGATPGRRHFAGHPEQEESGLVYMQARWMDPTTGTFLSVDPVLASISDPQSLNAYAYARNNPINLTDPNGMCVVMFSCGMILNNYSGLMAVPISANAIREFQRMNQLLDELCIGNSGVLQTFAENGVTYSEASDPAGEISSGSPTAPSQSSSPHYADAGSIPTDAKPAQPTDFDRAMDLAGSRATTGRDSGARLDMGSYVLKGPASWTERLTGATQGEAKVGDYRVTLALIRH